MQLLQNVTELHLPMKTALSGRLGCSAK